MLPKPRSTASVLKPLSWNLAQWTPNCACRFATTEAPSRRRLKFDATQPLTLRESLKIVQAREAKKHDARKQAMDHDTKHIAEFSKVLDAHGKWPLKRDAITTFQVNIGHLCNLNCQHCHVESGPTKVRENMDYKTVRRCLDILERTPFVQIVDITGGAPELNPHFKMFVSEVRAMAKHQVHVVASLPCYTDENTTKQRGKHVFPDSIAAIQQLNALGYGQPGSPLILDLVYNPGGPNLPPSQLELEADYRYILLRDHGVRFNSLLTITNMPIKRFADHLFNNHQLAGYMELLANSFNVSAVDGLMCRNTINIGWDGKLNDCDFSAALDIQSRDHDGKELDIWNIGKQFVDVDRAASLNAHMEQTASPMWCTGRFARVNIASGAVLALVQAVMELWHK